ncbi:MAG: hypothetical protein J6S96_04290 [Muribaculaceae bacterium]|nr:hypothetical protein [Muribaculaceae bacterium]
MIRLDKICIWTFITCFALMMWSGSLVKWIDELCCYTLLLTGFLDCLINHRWRAYLPLWLLLGIMTVYVVYSTFKGFNTLPYIMMDAIISLKPFVPFMVILAIKPQLNITERQIIKVLAVINVLEALVLLFMPITREYTLNIHIMFIGTTCMVAAMTYFYCSTDDKGHVARHHLAVVLTMIAIGLACTRAKYYAETVLALFLFLLYKPNMFKGVKPQYWVLSLVVIAAVVAVSWNKFSYYFITGNSETFDPTVAESFARPVLYATGGLILIDHFPLGSGLASFASYPSSVNYSSLYHEYGISKIYGLSEAMPDFICDAFYPLLAQFGIVGIALFIIYLVWAVKQVKSLSGIDAGRFRALMAVALMVICFLLVESVASTVPMQSWGMLAMMLMAFVASEPHAVIIENNKKSLYNERQFTSA